MILGQTDSWTDNQGKNKTSRNPTGGDIITRNKGIHFRKLVLCSKKLVQLVF